jgi:hypothetical protein
LALQVTEIVRYAVGIHILFLLVWLRAVRGCKLVKVGLLSQATVVDKAETAATAILVAWAVAAAAELAATLATVGMEAKALAAMAAMELVAVAAALAAVISRLAAAAVALEF